MDARFHVEHPKGINTAPAALLPDGRYWVDVSLRRRRDRLGEPTRLFVDSERWGTKVVELAEGKDDYVARFDEPAVVAVRVAGGSRSTWSVRAHHIDRPRGFATRLVRPVVDGLSEHTLQPGTYRLVLQRQDSGTQDRDTTLPLRLHGTLATLEVDVDRDGLVVVFPEPELHDLDVRVPGADAVEVILSARGPLAHDGMAVTDGGGNVRFPGLPAGTYAIRPATLAPMTVQVPCERVEYVPDAND